MRKTSWVLILCVVYFIPLMTFGQLVINEFCSKGSVEGFDGENNDWIELINISSSTINLSNYSLSDNINNISKWNFPSVELDSMQKILILCSGEDKKERVTHWESIVNENTFFKYFLGTHEPDSNWISDMNDSAWLVGLNGIGFGDNDDSTIIVNTSSLYMRHTFHVINNEDIVKLLLHADYDDSFVAYLNGIEIARSENIYGQPITYQTLATKVHEASINSGEEFEKYYFNNFQVDTLLKPGNNILAIQVHDFDSIPDDMSARFFLHIGVHSDTNYFSNASVWLEEEDTYYHSNFKLSEGENIIVSDSIGNIIDQKIINSSNTFISEGRFPDGIGNWCYFTPPTAGFTNDSSDCFNGISSKPIISLNSGWHANQQYVTITSSNNTQLFYTTNGDVPNTNDKLYSDTLFFDSTTVLSVRAFSSNNLPSKVVDRTYIINEDNHNLPVFSVITDSLNLWDWDTGIYALGANANPLPPYSGANFHESWSRWSRMEFFDENQIKQEEGELDLKIHGGYSRKFDQKSFRLDFKSKYTGDIEYPLIPQKQFINNFNNINLRNGGNESNSNRIKDAIFSTIAQKTNIDIMGYHPCILYLNGEYWGVYGMREKIDEHYIEANYNVSHDNLDLIGAKENVLHGDKSSFIEAYHLLLSIDSDDISFLPLFKNVFDINNYIDYYVFETIIQNKDWYAGKYNSKLWRDKSESGKWKFILYDTDQAFRDSPQQNFILEKTRIPTNNGYSIRSKYSKIFDLVMKNREFQCLFWNRYNSMLNDILHVDSVQFVVDNLKAQIIDAMPDHLNRWNPSSSLNLWEQYVDNITNSLQNRMPYALIQAKDMIESSLTYFIYQDTVDNSVYCDLSQGNSYTYQWLFNGDSIIGAIDSIHYPLESGYYYYLVTDSYGCQSFSDSIFAEDCGSVIDPILTQDSINNSLYVTCLGGTSPYSYQWFIDSTFIEGILESNCFPIDSGFYSVLVTDSNGCQSTDILFAKDCGSVIDPILTQDSINNSLYVTCLGGTSPYSYQWFIDSALVDNTDKVSLDIYTYGTYYAIIEDINGCRSFTNTISNKRLEVNIFPNPTSELINLQFIRLYGEKYTISVFDLHMNILHYIDLPDIDNNMFYTHTFDLDISRTGLYLIRLESSKNQIAKRFIYIE